MSKCFWNSCIRELEAFPKTPCTGSFASRRCAWTIKHAESNNCFWTWIRRNSTPEGLFDPLDVSEIATLLDIPESEVEEILESALTKLQNNQRFKTLKHLFHFPE